MRKTLSKIIIMLTIVSMGILPEHAGFAASNKDKAKDPLRVQYRWISPTGKPVKLKWKIKSQFAWTEVKKKKKTYQKPVIRTHVRFPKSMRFKEGEGEGLTFIKNPDDSPFSGGSEQLIAIDSLENTSTSTLRLFRKKRKSKKEKLIEMGLLISNRSQKDFLLVHDSCSNLGLRIDTSTKRLPRGYSFLGVYCESAKKGAVDAHFYIQPNAEFKAKIRGKKKRMGEGWYRYRIFPPKDKKKKSKKKSKKSSKKKPDYAGKVKVSSDQGSAVYRLYYSPGGSKGIRGFAGLGLTYLSYSETTGTGNISLGTMTLTAKGGISYFFNKKLDIGMSFYANMLNLFSSITPATNPAAQFLGINGRIGYTVLETPGWTLRPMIGWYFWKMFVSDKSYGISSLLGPQLYLFNLFPAKDNRKWWLYVKYAPISASFGSFSLSSMELAVGAGYPIGTLKNLPLSITLDISTLSIPADSTANAPSLFTISAGAQISF